MSTKMLGEVNWGSGRQQVGMKLGSGELYLNYLNYPTIPTIPTISTPLGMFQTKAGSAKDQIWPNTFLPFHYKSKTGLGSLLTILRESKN